MFNGLLLLLYYTGICYIGYTLLLDTFICVITAIRRRSNYNNNIIFQPSMYTHITVVDITHVSARADGRKKGMKKLALIYNYNNLIGYNIVTRRTECAVTEVNRNKRIRPVTYYIIYT